MSSPMRYQFGFDADGPVPQVHSTGSPRLSLCSGTSGSRRSTQERLHAPGVRPGIAHELRKHVAILERQIAELGD